MMRNLALGLLATGCCLAMAGCNQPSKKSWNGDNLNNVPESRQGESADVSSSTQFAPSTSNPDASAATSSAYPTGQPPGAPPDNAMNGADTQNSGGERSPAIPPPVRPPK